MVGSSHSKTNVVPAMYHPKRLSERPTVIAKLSSTVSVLASRKRYGAKLLTSSSSQLSLSKYPDVFGLVALVQSYLSISLILSTLSLL